MHTNRLIHEKSPYLLQHAHNPVDWYAWGTEAFEKARTEDKPIFLSIGYSTCHWCHVMERESFENDEIAAIMNRLFVNIKVDREERPDVDRIYMTFVQASTGSGGWPMSVWLTPDLTPIFGGTYFPPDSRWGRPGFQHILEQISLAWGQDRSRIIQSGAEIIEQLEEHLESAKGGRVDAGVLDSGFYAFRRAFDTKLGGFGGAPKFPRPSTHNFLFRYRLLNANQEATDMVLLTLREMAKGGMNDQLGGGFHRYSVDPRWFVPHFEKMLYDQAQLAVSYLEAYQITGDTQYAEVARAVFDYVLRDMTHENGGFFSAEDADSVIDPAKPDEKGEGAFYVWSRAEIEKVLDPKTAEWFSYRYGVEADGNVREDPHSEFTGKNILHERYTVAETAARFGVAEAEVEAELRHAAEKLRQERNKRVRPHLDDKILTAWNGLMISAFAKGGQVLDVEHYKEAALAAAAFVLERLYPDGRLLRRWRDGEAAVDAFLDDYAFFVQALLDLYETTFVDHYVQIAEELTTRMRELFEDAENGGFYSTCASDPSLVMRIKEDYDGAEPAGNSIAILNLFRLARITGKEEYRATADRALAAFASKIVAGPSGLPQMLVAHMFGIAVPKQIVLAGQRTELEPLLRTVYSRFLPFHTLLSAQSSALNGELAGMKAVDGRPTAYVCENFACQLPTSDLGTFAQLLK